jgi:DUF1680 family protein
MTIWDKDFSRRKFLLGAAAATGMELLPKPLLALSKMDATGSAGAALGSAPAKHPRPGFMHRAPIAVEPFSMHDVRLRPGPFLDQMEINRKFMGSIPNDRLLHMFRLTSKLSSSAQPLGGWENPKCELRGHFSGGHYLSASAQMYAATGDEDVKKKADELVAQLAICQKANKNGYLSAFPIEEFDRLRNGQPVWAPFYTIHKIMAGHFDMYRHTGNEQALDTLEKMAGWVGQWVFPLSDDQMARILEVEQGGMFEVLCNLAAATGKSQYLGIAHRFDQKQFFDPLARFKDELTGLHANTNIPKVIGTARFYEITGDRRYYDISAVFWKAVTGHRIYATGGTGDGEYWTTAAGHLKGTLNEWNEECCCGYNMLKLTRHLFHWTADPKLMDYYERTLFNSRLGTQNSEGMKGYFVPLGSGYWKYYNTRWDSFWCCTGTGLEDFSKFNNTIYYHDDQGIYVNLYIASEVNWKEKGVRLRQETNFPEQASATFVIQAAHPVEMALNLRIPYWATEGGTVKLNGETIPVFSNPSSYLTLYRVWKNGDRVEIMLPMSLRTEALPDDETRQVVMYGPCVLAGRLGRNGLTKQMLFSAYDTSPRGTPAVVPPLNNARVDKFDWVEPSGPPMTFHLSGQSEPTELIPFYQVHGEKYAVYWQLKEPHRPRFFL